MKKKNQICGHLGRVFREKANHDGKLLKHGPSTAEG